MIAVRCFSLAVVENAFHLSQINPGRWHETVPDLTHIAIADELRGRGLVKYLPANISRSWIQRLPHAVADEDQLVTAYHQGLHDTAMAVNLRRPRVMLILNEHRADMLAKRLDWFKQPTLMPGTLWNAQPRPKGAIRLKHPESGREYEFTGATYHFLWTDVKMPLCSSPATRSDIDARLAEGQQIEAAKLAAE